MPTRTSYAEGIPSWVDLSTPDVSAAKDFYGALFGWEYEEAPTDSNPYIMAMKKGLAAAGIGESLDANMPPVWTTYFAVQNADASAQKIADAGGKVLTDPFDAMEAGRMAIAAGPGGEVFGIWQAKNHFGAGIVNEHGSLSWNELMTDDVDGALEFYSTVFGHGTQTVDMGGGFMYSTLDVGDRQIAGVMAKPDPNMPNFWGPYFAVDDADAAAEAMKANGGKVSFGPQETEGVGVMVGGTDPQGAYFTVMKNATPVD